MPSCRVGQRRDALLRIEIMIQDPTCVKEWSMSLSEELEMQARRNLYIRIGIACIQDHALDLVGSVT